MRPCYAELHCLSNFTFLRGASHPEELALRARELGYAALAITDECSLAGAARAHLAAKQCGLELIIGAEIALADGPKLVLLACDREGYGNLSALITRGRRNAAKGEYRLARADLEGGLAGCLALMVPDSSAAPPPWPSPYEGEGENARWLAGLFPGRAWLAVELLCGPDDRARLAALTELGRAAGLPLVAAGDVHMHARGRRALQDTLTAIRLKTPVAEAGLALHPNGERHLRPLERLGRLYPPELLIETVHIAGRCRFSLDELRYEYPEELVPAGETPASWLRKLTEEGLQERFGRRTPIPTFPLAGGRSELSLPLPGGGPGWGCGAQIPPEVRQLVEHELALIAELRYEPYFLTVHDIVAFARSQGILCQGRGSAANSAVCYALGITEVDPSRMSMLFERFISRERNEPPDIDVDFEHERREEVIQYLYAKYGRDRAALAATVISYRPKSAVRDVGKALGFDLDRIDQLTRQLAWWDGRQMLPERLAEAGLDPKSAVVKRLVVLVNELIGFPRHLSQHVGGFVISRGPLSRLVPIENAAMAERTVIQWDKDDLDALGLLKVDVLALGMLTAIRRALDLINARPVGRPSGRQQRPLDRPCRPEGRPTGKEQPITLADIPPEDPAVYEMLGHGDSVGVFQVESRAQMAMLPRLRPRRFYDLVIEVALVRPGPIQGGMVHPYLRRRQGLEPVDYPSNAVKTVLERTLGVPIFQEQVMQLAVVAAGFTPGEADRLRRSMAAWKRKGGLEPFEKKLTGGMLERGYSLEFAQAIFRQIQGFGEYGFPESHAASFALLVYVSAWLKRYEPAAFLCALLNSQPMGFYAPSQLIQDARRRGVEVRAVDVTASGWECALEAPHPHPGLPPKRSKEPQPPPPLRGRAGVGVPPAARLGLRLVSGLGQDAAERIVARRAERPFDSVEDLARRAALSQRELKLLAAAGALTLLAGHRRQAHWQAAGAAPLPGILAASRFDEAALELPPPGEGADLVADYAALGFTLGRHPLALLREKLARLRFVAAGEANAYPDRKLARVAGLVTGRQRPGTASGVIFVTLEDETGCTNVIVHGTLADKQRRELLGARLLGVYGVMQREGEVVHLIAKRLVDHSRLLGTLATTSRDFH